MFLDLPLEIQHSIYDCLDVKHRTKLNMALPHTHQITHTLNTNPMKNKQLRYLSYMVEKKRYTNTNQLSQRCMKFISENRDDPTIQKICKDLDIAFDPDTSITALITDITKNQVPPTKAYVIPDDANLTHIQHAIAKHATPNTFDILYAQNTSTIPHVADQLLRKRRADRSFFFELVNLNNRELLEHIMALHEEQEQEEWVASGLAYLKDIAHLFFVLESVKTLCEVVQISEEKKKQILQMAIDQMDIDLADYMISIGTTL